METNAVAPTIEPIDQIDERLSEFANNSAPQ
jgi:hypothetical protein